MLVISSVSAAKLSSTSMMPYGAAHSPASSMIVSWYARNVRYTDMPINASTLKALMIFCNLELFAKNISIAPARNGNSMGIMIKLLIFISSQLFYIQCAVILINSVCHHKHECRDCKVDDNRCQDHCLRQRIGIIFNFKRYHRRCSGLKTGHCEQQQVDAVGQH